MARNMRKLGEESERAALDRGKNTRKGGAAESYLPALHCIADGCARIALWQMTPLDDGRPTRGAHKQWRNFILESADNAIASERRRLGRTIISRAVIDDILASVHVMSAKLARDDDDDDNCAI